MKRILSMLLMLIAIAAGTLPGVAQQASTKKPKQPTAPIKGCQAGQMRCVNKNMRMSAAIRNANRRAQAMRQQQGAH
jgi:hypothetical protein